jgi:rhodanese-related sulfurtransferase
MTRSVGALLAEARARLAHRPDPAELESAQEAGAMVVDIRPIHQRQADGEIPGSVVIDRNVLEWRLDPASPHRIPEASADRPVVVVCNEGYASSLAASTLCELGVHATDLDGGIQAWIASGRPTVPPASTSP